MIDTASTVAATEALLASVCAASGVQIGAPAVSTSPSASPPLSAAEWVDLVAACRQIVNRVDAVSTIALAALARTAEHEVEDGTVVPALRDGSDPRLDAGALAADALGVSTRDAEDRTHHALRLTGPLRALLPAMADGTLDRWRARLVSRELELHDADDATVRTVGCAIADRLRAGRLTTGGQLRRATRDLVALAAPGSVRTQRERAVADRSLTRWGCAPGQDEWTWRVPAADAVAAWGAVDAHARHLRAQGSADTLDQARSDALLELVMGRTSVRYDAILTAPATAAELAALDTLTPSGLAAPPRSGREGEPVAPSPSRARLVRYAARPARAGSPDDLVSARLGGEPVVTAGWLADTLDTARHRTLHPVHPATGALLPSADDVADDLTRRAYRPTRAQLAYVTARDGGCRFPGCVTSARSCDVDHVRAWVRGDDTGAPASGGATVRWNLMLLCRRHHRIKQLPGWAVRLYPDGRVHWRTPTGAHLWSDPVDHRPGPPIPARPDPAAAPATDPARPDPTTDPEAAPPRPAPPSDTGGDPPHSWLEHVLELAVCADRRTPAARRASRRAQRARDLVEQRRAELTRDGPGWQLRPAPRGITVEVAFAQAASRPDPPPPF